MGYQDVATLLNSGNAVFSATAGASANHAEKIAAALSNHFGFEIPMIVKSRTEFHLILTGNSVAVKPDAHSRFFVDNKHRTGRSG
jgi:uncharacterized protein (DUF1697 family)